MVAGQCLKRVQLDRRLRLLGVRVGKLEKAGAGAEANAVREPTAPYPTVVTAEATPGTLDLF